MEPVSQARPEGFQFREITGVSAQAELARLLSSGFPVPEGGSFYDDFPVWDERFGARVFRVGAYCDGMLVASAGVRAASLGVPGASLLPVALVGGVVTHPSWRGRGLASRLVALAMGWRGLREDSLFVLWGSEQSLYARLGFRPFGSQLRASVRSVLEGRSCGGLGASERLEEGWSPSLFGLMARRSEGLVVTEADRAWIGAHRNTAWFRVERNGAPAAWAAVGRGIDLGGIVHEWGGDPAVLRGLLGGLSRRFDGLQIIGSRPLFERFGLNPEGAAQEPLCLARTVDGRTSRQALLLESQVWFWGLDGA